MCRDATIRPRSGEGRCGFQEGEEDYGFVVGEVGRLYELGCETEDFAQGRRDATV